MKFRRAEAARFSNVQGRAFELLTDCDQVSSFCLTSWHLAFLRPLSFTQPIDTLFGESSEGLVAHHAEWGLTSHV